MITEKFDFRSWMSEMIFESYTPKGKAFDIVVIISIISISLLVLAESVESLNNAYGTTLINLSWFFVIIFTIEYLLRVIFSKKRKKYVISFFGIVDLLAILPFYLSILFLRRIS